MKFNKKQKAVLEKATALLDEAETIIAGVKSDFSATKERNDEYYGLEDIEVRVGEALQDLKSNL